MRLLLKVLLNALLVTILVTTVHSGDERDRSDDNDSSEQLRAFDDDLSHAESVRNVRLIDDGEAWHGVQRIPNEDDRPLEARPQKRRRLRKRKRRPQHILQQQQLQQQPFGEEQQGEIQSVRSRRRRPVRLDEVNDGWKEMEAEGPQRSYSRRRVGPVYQEAAHPTTGHDPSTTEHTTSIKDIKDILKQTGGLSLSEILLQKNLTLSDLLSGNQNAISALSERPLPAHSETEKFDQAEEAAIREVSAPVRQESHLDARRKDEQRKRFSQMYNQANKMYGELTTKYEVVTEGTTEKRIFVPSHPKYYTSVNFKPEFELATEAPKRTTPKLPMTSAQINMKIKKADVKATEKPAPVPISLTKVFGYTPEGATEPITKGPLKMSLDLEELSEQNVVLPDNTDKEFGKALRVDQTTTIGSVEVTNEPIITTALPSTVTPTTPTPRQSTEATEVKLMGTHSDDTPTSEKLTTTQRFSKKPSTTIKPTTAASTAPPKRVTASAKDEIMEIMKNHDVKEELVELLTSRNMTVEQLVEQRERGSSQRHLAEIFHNNTQESEGSLAVEEVTSFKAPVIEGLTRSRKPKGLITTTTPTTSITTATPHMEVTTVPSHPSKPLEDINMSSEEITASAGLSSTSFPTYKIETKKISKEIPPLHIPIWKTIYPSIYLEPDHSNQKLELDAIEQSIQQAVDDGLSELSRHNNNLNEYDDYIQLPTGVKSAIFASLAIIGMSLVLFLTILVVFRWSQKHKKRLCYGGTGAGSGFTCSKIKSPILQHEPKRTIRTFVSETLGKRRNFYAQHFRQSMSDPWEDNERPYQ